MARPYGPRVSTPKVVLPLVAGLLLALVVPGSRVTAAPPAAAARATHEVVVTGNGVATFPAFDPAVSRYAVTTSPGTGGTITVAATSAARGAVVRVDGVVAPTGKRTVTGLKPGDEVAVFVDDAQGRSAYSYVYLPDDFPTLERVTPAASEPTFDHVMLTLARFRPPPDPYFEVVVDANGVPAHLATNRTTSSMDLKLQPNGHFSVARGTGNPAYPDSEIVEFDAQWREVGRHQTVGIQHTDGHDSILLEDGSRYLIAYEPDGAGKLDAVVQHVSAAGDLLFSWDSKDHVAESVVNTADYAHINSVHVMADGNLLLSFRHLSAVFKVARHDGDGYTEGDVLWKLGGRELDFTFVGEDGQPGDFGPCAQHTATQLANGNIVVFDNGSASFTGSLCVDPANPDGPPVDHTPSRVVEWSLDEENGVATVVRDHSLERRDGQPGGRFAIFAGSAQPLPTGGSMVGWASSTDAIASELGPDGSLRWELVDPAATGSERLFSYRAFALDLPDATPPTVAVPTRDGAVYIEGQRVAPPTCRDRGGSSLKACAVTPVDTRTVGARLVTVTARDGAGNVTRVTRRYRVVHRHRPDATIRAAGATRVVGVGTYGARPQQLVQISRRQGSFVAFVRVRNNGSVSDRFTLTPSLRSRDFTARIVGSPVSPVLRPGQSWGARLVVTPRVSARRGDQAAVRVIARSRGNPARLDVIWLRARRT